MTDRRFVKLLTSSLAAAVVGLFVSRALGLSIFAGLIVSAFLVLAASGAVLLVYGKNGELARPKLLIAIVITVIAACIATIAMVWYALANSTDL